MNYQKKYKEALERARELSQTTTGARYEYIFPELAESKDERIRKALIRFHKSSIDVDGIKGEDIISWLKRQGEQKTITNIPPREVILSIWDLGNEWKGLTNGSISTEYGTQLNYIQKHWHESEYYLKVKQGKNHADKAEPKFKVKYAGSEYNVFEIKDIAGVTFYGIEDEPNHIDYVKAENCEIISGYAIKENGSPYPTKPAVFSEQKPTWSEEDEDRAKDTIYFLDTAKKHYASTVELDACIDWLKSIKDRVQPIQEWSKEEQQIIEDAETWLDTLCDYLKDSSCEFIPTVKEVISKLKSLKDRVHPQNRWKPSYEQIEVLQKSIKAYNEVSFIVWSICAHSPTKHFNLLLLTLLMELGQINLHENHVW